MKKFENFQRALKNLKEIETRQPPYDTITQTGMVSLFEICFEQAWKAMKEQLEISGYSEHKIGSPRVVIKIDCFHDSPGSRVVQRPIDLLHEKKSNISTLTGQQGWRKEKGEPLGLLLARPDAMQGKKLPPGAMQR